MKKQLALTKEQMEYLVSLGVDTSGASMYYSGGSSSYNKLLPKTCSQKLHPGSIPVFTLSDILEIMPSIGSWLPSLHQAVDVDNVSWWALTYTKGQLDDDSPYWHATPLEAAYYTLCQAMMNNIDID